MLDPLKDGEKELEACPVPGSPGRQGLQEQTVTGVPVAEAVGDMVFRNGGQLLVNVQKKPRTAFPQLTRWLRS